MDNENVEKKKLDPAVIGKFLFALAVLHFFFFGYICNVYKKYPDENLLFLYRSFFNAKSWAALPILVVIIAAFAFSEDFLVVAVKKMIWTVPVMVIASLFWYGINYLPMNGIAEKYIHSDTYEPVAFGDIFTDYFISVQGYLNIIILVIVVAGAAILGGYLKIKYRERFMRSRRLIEA